MNSEKQKIIIDQLSKKFNKLAELEKKQIISKNIEHDEFKISRTIYGCIGGFIILRTFSKESFTPFILNIIPERIEVFLKTKLPIKARNGQIYSLYKLMDNGIGIKLGIGSKIDLGSIGGGINSGDLQFDGFQIIICNNDQIQDITETLEDINFAIFSSNEIKQLEVDKRNLTETVKSLSVINNPLIITEGKTDWKYFITALKYFHLNGEFLNIHENWFLKFGSKKDVESSNCNTDFELENSVTKLSSILESFIESRNLDNQQTYPIRMGIFDSDDKQAKSKEDFKSNVFSCLIEPNDISTELLFSIEEIKTIVQGKRLYLGDEFDTKTGQLLIDRKINLGNDNNIRNKSGKKVIIDSNVYDQNGNNIALSKDEFSKQIFSNCISISSESWNNFRHVFEKITSYTTN